MMRLALFLGPVAVIFAAAATCFGSAAFSAGTGPSPSPSPSPSPYAEPSPRPAPDFDVPEPSYTPAPTPTPVPTPAHTGPLKEGDWVQVSGTGSCLNVRMQPSLAAPYPEGDPATAILNCLPDGFIAQLSFGGIGGGVAMPVSADGHWWWYLLGQGWAAEEWLTFHHEGGIPYPMRPELATAGLIAYIGSDQNVWVMNADGSGQRMIAARSSENEYLGPLQWSPPGNLLSFTVRGYEKPGGVAVSTRIIDTAGAVMADLPGLVEAVWSPDATRLSAIRYETDGGMGGYTGPLVVFDLRNGVETPVATSNYQLTAAAWSPDGRQLAYTCLSFVSQESQPDGTTKETRVECGGDGVRVVSADGSEGRVLLPYTADGPQYYSNPSWSPDGRTISLSTSPTGTTCRGYALVDVASGGAGTCVALPPWGGAGGGCGGSSETGATDWSPDGRYLAYHSMYGAGTNGVYLYDMAAGTSRVIPNSNPSSMSFSADGAHLVFGGSRYVWVADADGSGLAVLVAGSGPAWQPR